MYASTISYFFGLTMIFAKGLLSVNHTPTPTLTPQKKKRKRKQNKKVRILTQFIESCSIVIPFSDTFQPPAWRCSWYCHTVSCNNLLIVLHENTDRQATATLGVTLLENAHIGRNFLFKAYTLGPGWVAQLIRASIPYVQVAVWPLDRARTGI